MHMTSFVMTPYDVICAEIVVNSDRCIYHLNSSYLASNIKVEYQKMTKFGNYPGDFKISNLELGDTVQNV